MSKSPSQNKEPKQVSTRTLTTEQQQWYEWACVNQICIDVPVMYLPILMGKIAVLIPIENRRPSDPPYDLVIIDLAMREHPMN